MFNVLPRAKSRQRHNRDSQRDAEDCQEGLLRYVSALQRFHVSVHREEWDRALLELQLAKAALTCRRCRRDESIGSRVLPLFYEVLERWNQPADPCHERLLEAINERLAAPSHAGREVEQRELRFTHSGHSETFRHGAHAGRSIEWLVGELAAGRQSRVDDDMVIHAVYFHGKLRSLNNRHMAALVRHGEWLEAGESAPCRVRQWPLVPGLRLDDGSNKEVVVKFIEAWSTSSDGQKIRMRSRSSSRGKDPTLRIRDSCRVHIRNIDFNVDEQELGDHICRHFRDAHRLEAVRIARRPTGRSQGHATLEFESLDAAQGFVDTGLPPLRDRALKISLDTMHAAGEAVPAEGLGRVCCRQCLTPCARLVDVFLIEGRRQAGRGYGPHTPNAYLCISRRSALLDCPIVPHDQREKYPYKLGEIRCSACSTDLGNLQDESALNEEDIETFGKEVVHYRCHAVCLELCDDRDRLLEVSKWSILYAGLATKAQEGQHRFLLADLTTNDVRSLHGFCNSNRDIRLVPRTRVSLAEAS